MMKRPQKAPTSSPTFWLTGLALAWLAVPSLLAESPPATPTATPETPPAAGWRVYVDPETGELTSNPSREQVESLSKRLEQSLSRSDEGLVPFDLAFGGRGVYLAGRFKSALVVRFEDGQPVLSCVDDAAHAAAHLETVAPPAGRETIVWEEK